MTPPYHLKPQVQRDDLVGFALRMPARIENKRALQHLREGFDRRVLMLDVSIRFILDTAQRQGGKAISPFVAKDLAIHLNAFYLNMCGALDNLAWALQHEDQLLPGVTESSARRTSIDLFGPRFLGALEAKSPALVAFIGEHKRWNSELRDLRDPAVHRIPIYAVPGVLTPAQGAEIDELNERATELFRAGDFDGGSQLLYKTTTLGTYQAWMSLSHDAGYEFRSIPEQVQEDDRHFVAVAAAVLDHLFAPRPGTVAA